MRAAIVSYLLKQINGILFSTESLEKRRFSGDFSGDRSLNINPFSTNVPLLYPLKTSENTRFLMLSGGIEVEHWFKMG